MRVPAGLPDPAALHGPPSDCLGGGFGTAGPGGGDPTDLLPIPVPGPGLYQRLIANCLHGNLMEGLRL